jgi:carbon monoxide dehydrogenase subunit G
VIEDGIVDVTGTAIMRAAPDRVWATLTDPAVLAASIPGCERMERSGPDVYRFTISAGIGPLHSSFNGRVAVFDQDEPRSFGLTASGSGGAGSVRIRVRFGLAAFAGGDTALTYTATGEVAGLLASAGQRLISAVAQGMAAEFFRAVDARLQEGNGADAGGSAPGLAAVVPTPRPPVAMAPDACGPGGTPGPQH